MCKGSVDQCVHSHSMNGSINAQAVMNMRLSGFRDENSYSPQNHSRARSSSKDIKIRRNQCNRNEKKNAKLGRQTDKGGSYPGIYPRERKVQQSTMGSVSFPQAKNKIILLSAIHLHISMSHRSATGDNLHDVRVSKNTYYPDTLHWTTQ